MIVQQALWRKRSPKWATSSCTRGAQDLALGPDVIGLSGSGDAGDGNSPDAINRLCDAEDLRVLCQAHPHPSVQSFLYLPTERRHFLTDRLARLATPAGLSLA